MAEPIVPEPSDRDRLFRGCILEYRARSLLGNNFEMVYSLTSEERWANFEEMKADHEEQLANGDVNEMRAKVVELMHDVYAAIDAWQAIERIRLASRAGQRKRRGSKHVD